MCKMPCQRVPLYMDANLLGRQFGIFLKNYDGSKLIDIGSCRGHCMAFQNPLGSDINQGCFPSKMETLDFESNGFVFQNEMIVKTCRCASFVSCHS
ncbi:Oidioi.mRNA.OKI2018_I69.chr2.g5296.t1.cds [Oikopleura dioica]|uniref:Oidioi.mRNA.OKI2018_I69.chr2.g5296.t1.cds n=1 Tax=Oikopleura dioica TaxID=34765 RepID=A0ABN7T6H7_OIKDI|nr:Oidioi.mRNA.OKI2018_I69.chr2.g5296.t1.cds [Oikopleura dioica]